MKKYNVTLIPGDGTGPELGRYCKKSYTLYRGRDKLGRSRGWRNCT
jgi:hypothetical protein